jgi:hypothetical protein
MKPPGIASRTKALFAHHHLLRPVVAPTKSLLLVTTGASQTLLRGQNC